jgi:hypothetical protein
VQAAGGVSWVHSLPTDAAQKQSLQQGRTFPWCASSISPGWTDVVLLQAGLIGFILFPAHVSGMRILDKDLPLIDGQALNPTL